MPLSYLNDMSVCAMMWISEIIYASQEHHIQGELAIKKTELATASGDAEKLLHDISESTAIAEVEKGKVATIVEQVSLTAAVREINIIFIKILYQMKDVPPTTDI